MVGERFHNDFGLYVLLTRFITKHTEGVGVLMSEKLADNDVGIFSHEFQIAMVESLL